ncbi:transporter substrate-binding domain-containing protein [Streptomyces sp. NPDC050610]|uniref:transporter substrate-binding domain-containing protein n=1 Tax=Streptomyces sp. NPDC050610 TaxID=3157097 RepID=UPI00342F808B
MGRTGNRSRTIRVWAAAAALAGVVLAGCSSDPPSLFAEGKVEVGAKSDQPGTSYSPHDGEFNGFDITVAREVLDRVGVKTPSFKGVLSKNRVGALDKGDVQLIAATYSITKERMAPTSKDHVGVDFVGPYAATQQGLLVRTKDAGRFKKLKDLEGEEVCVWEGTTSEALLKSPAYQLIHTTSKTDARDCVKLLRDGLVAAVSTDQLLLYGFMAVEPKLTVVRSFAFGAPNYYGIAMAKGHRGDCKKLRQALTEYALSNDWDRDFQLNLSGVPKDIRDSARPTSDAIDTYSCRDEPGNRKMDD